MMFLCVFSFFFLLLLFAFYFLVISIRTYSMSTTNTICTLNADGRVGNYNLLRVCECISGVAGHRLCMRACVCVFYISFFRQSDDDVCVCAFLYFRILFNSYHTHTHMALHTMILAKWCVPLSLFLSSFFATLCTSIMLVACKCTAKTKYFVVSCLAAALCTKRRQQQLERDKLS